MKIRSGGHDYEGVSYVSFDTPHFFILDMFNFRSIHVSIQHESAWVQAGAILGEVYYKIANKSKTHAFPAGVCPTVGVGGHFGGGGYGNMMRKYGLSIDNIVDAKIVDVNGKLLDRKSMGEDLFWAITGGGGSSYGVVLSYKIKLVRVPEKVTVFRISRRYSENFADLIYSYQRIVAELPKELFIRLTLDVVNNTNRATFYALFLGNSKELVSTMKSNFPELGLARIHCFEMSWIESVLFWTNFPIGTPIEVLLSRVPQVFTHLKRKSDFVKDPIPKQGLEFIFEKMVELKTPMLTFNPYGGRMGEIPMWEKPFPHRQGNIAKLQYATNWDEDGEEAENYYLNLTRLLYYYMTPFVSKDPRGAFVCYRDLDIGIYHDIMMKKSTNYINLTMIGDGVGAVNYGVKYFKDNFYRDWDIGTTDNGKNSYNQGKVYGEKYFKTATNSFLQCLSSFKIPNDQILNITHTPKSSNYASVLDYYIRNCRFNTLTTPKPTVILPPFQESQFQAIVNCAKKEGIQLRTRSGGHDYEGLSYTSKTAFVILDMFNYRSVDINMDEETAWVQAGATIGELYYKIWEKSKVHAFPAGVCPTMGVGGHFSGGGYGNLMRKYGISVDNVVEARGRILDRKSMGEDLFWAIRGGGGASFGLQNQTSPCSP
ncbi:hypothetical protein RD792_002296 [Penstemon davidsonii]|uniref:FAD-binding PCMH-type domain-containing protein n=1 Tax=Penstemon davidsonii TaxID=160366 RepID=A0ABR0DQN3_9LAMI|nr:hypothetical protein RD792_002296 [Penstemon davidsonii]